MMSQTIRLKLQQISQLTHVLPVVALCLVVLAVVHVTYAAWTMDSTFDEHHHWGWSQQVYEHSNTSRASRANFRSTTPIILLNVWFADLARQLGLGASNDHFVRRLPNILWLIGIFVVAWKLCRSAIDARAAWLAVILCALDANLITHLALLTVDGAFAFTVLLFCYAAHKYVIRPQLTTAVLLGFACAFSAMAKFSALFLLPCIGLMCLVLGPHLKLRWAHVYLLPLAFVAAVLLVNTSYLWIKVGTPLGDITFYSRYFKNFAAQYPNLALPLAADFLTGIDHCLATERNQVWAIPYLDDYYTSGIWHYFIVHWFIKTPVFVILVTLLGCIRAVQSGLVVKVGLPRFVLGVFLVFLGYFSLIFRTMVGFRYALMCVPLLYCIAACGFFQTRPKLLEKILLAALVVVSSVELALYWGNPLSFTNLAVQPKRFAYRLTSDSNIHWGQNHAKVGEYQAKFGVPRSHVFPFHILPGRNLLDLNYVTGVWYNRDEYRWLRANLSPSAHAGHTYLIYDVSDSDFERYLQSERYLSPFSTSTTRCPATSKDSATVDGNGTKAIKAPGSFICVVVAENSVFYLRNLERLTSIGVQSKHGSCNLKSLSPGQEAWFKAAPGTYEICTQSGTTPTFEIGVKRGSLSITSAPKEKR